MKTLRVRRRLRNVKIVIFTAVEKHCILHRPVGVMNSLVDFPRFRICKGLNDITNKWLVLQHGKVHFERYAITRARTQETKLYDN